MATIAPTKVGLGSQIVAAQTLTVSDDFKFKNGQFQLFHFLNSTGSTVTINFLGDNVSDVNCPGLGNPISTAGGYDIVLADGEDAILSADTIKAFLTDTNNLPAITSDVPDVEVFLTEL